ncbi:bZIP transcription factor 11-like [Magnolia sinica]|uniref:bZIP transcription factor 11-like n=1 Tax=Magnolia sinica TaxID=86752 RepID=UPI002658A4E2|nr:bZIP transcription factor 11-like [Magnolia sinica]
MATSSGTSSGSGSTLLQNSGSEEDLQHVMDQRKLKRMQSNRESARRSRMRKQKHLDDLMAQVAHLRKENNQILTSLNITTQHYLGVESENSVLRTQIMELTSRLHSLNEIIHYMHGSHDHDHDPDCGPLNTLACDSYTRPWDLQFLNQQPIMASADMFQY